MSRIDCLYKNINLPTDVIKYIFSFLICKCSKCSLEKDEYYLYKNCEIYKYYNIFDDRFFFPREMEEFNFLCWSCKNKFFQVKVCKKENKIFLMDYTPI